MENNSEIIIYNTEDGLTKVEVSFIDDNVWLTQDQMAVLFQKSKSTICLLYTSDAADEL